MPIDPYIIQRALPQFPTGGAPVAFSGFPVTHPGLTARSAAHAALKAAEQHMANITKATQYAPADLAPDLVTEFREALTDTLRARTAGQFVGTHEGYVRMAERAAEAAESAAAPLRPKLDPESTTQLIRTDQAWNNHIKPMLTAGKQWGEIIPTLDTDGLLAAERFARGHEASTRDRFHQHEVDDVVAGISRMSERRVIEIAPPQARETLREAQDTREALDFTRNVAGWMQQVTPRDTATHSIALTRSAFAVGVQRPVDTSPEGQEAYRRQLAGETPSAAVEHGPGAESVAA